MRVGLAIALAYLGYILVARHAADQHWASTQSGGERGSDANAKFNASYGGSAVKILQFYARDGVITDDQSTIICYGVVNAKSLRMDPPAEGVYPALNKCIEVSPHHDTKYTLTAVGNDSQIATAQFTLTVKPDVANLPYITKFAVVKHTVEAGKHYFTIYFEFQNARKVSIDPPVFSPLEDSAPYGQWLVAPEATTTYTLTVTDAKGRKASKELTVEVPTV
jgi:hypothetical protein